jgi:Txe/YoeB family toxin of toxin-antitoxin system
VRNAKWKIVYTKQSQKDAKNIKNAGLKERVLKLLQQIEKDPWDGKYKKLVGDLSGAFSRRINIQHRLVYQIYEDEKLIKIIRMWTHYE